MFTANTDDLDDETLMLRYCGGDLLAFKELYRRHNPGLYRFIAWRSPRTEWVDEIIQDSWTALHHARKQYQSQDQEHHPRRASFRTYLYQIARHRLIDLLRQHQLILAVELGHDEDGEAIFEQLSNHFNSQEQKSPEAQLNQKQSIAGLHKALEQLPSEQKEALVLQQFNDLSLDEIAMISEVPVETVKSRLRYAMRKLRQHFVHHTEVQEELV